MQRQNTRFKSWPKLSSPKKVWGEVGAKVTVLLLVIFGGYYIFFLAPRLALPNAYLQAQKVLAEHRINLLQNRIALVELAHLSPNSADLFNKEAQLLQQLQQTNTDGIKSLGEKQKFQPVLGVPNEFLDFFNNDLRPAVAPLLLKERQILEQQQGLIASLTNLHSITANLLNYHAAQDLGVLDHSLKPAEAAARAEAAKAGIGKISENLIAFEPKSKELELLQAEIQKTQNILDIKKLVQQFTILQERVLSAQFALISSDTAVKLLTRQTNLILEYDLWLKKISYYQAKLATKD